MQRTTLIQAVQEARRFICKAEQCLKYESNDMIWYQGSKETGAAKRASMDLTRILADVRQGR